MHYVLLMHYGFMYFNYMLGGGGHPVLVIVSPGCRDVGCRRATEP